MGERGRGGGEEARQSVEGGGGEMERKRDRAWNRGEVRQMKGGRVVVWGWGEDFHRWTCQRETRPTNELDH